ncbi:hypothetical protein LCM20_08960 [Halobacillus litoralis]|uniref:hypothetical protein n=1 Tax=Halobacillus litoralis TaxID=45668 RepID=UPI001CD35C43|nr:hypothetical protein [Halobacillus litoralis]MCA0970716.1 hypothetical protein [Halobacillus litoralis]
MYALRPRVLIYSLIAIASVVANILMEVLWDSLVLYTIVLLLALPFAWIRFYFSIEDNHVLYVVKWFGRDVLTRRIGPEEMEDVRFKRVGWSRRAAFIKRKKGFTIRLAVSEDTALYERLLDFAVKHDVAISKTEDYKRLEKWY